MLKNNDESAEFIKKNLTTLKKEKILLISQKV